MEKIAKLYRWIVLGASGVFVVGAVFMLVYSFGGPDGFFWAGLAVGLVAGLALVLANVARIKEPKKEKEEENPSE